MNWLYHFKSSWLYSNQNHYELSFKRFDLCSHWSIIWWFHRLHKTLWTIMFHEHKFSYRSNCQFIQFLRINLIMTKFRARDEWIWHDSVHFNTYRFPCYELITLYYISYQGDFKMTLHLWFVMALMIFIRSLWWIHSCIRLWWWA